MSSGDPERFAETAMPAQEGDFRRRLQALAESSPLSHYEKFLNFAVFTPRQTIARFLARQELFQMVKEVPGSIFECGVLFGGGVFAFAHFSAIFEPVNCQRTVVGFDTFEGLPEIHAKDEAGTESGKRFAGAMGFDSQAELEKAAAVFDLNRTLPHIPKIELVRGDVTQTMGAYFEANPHCLVALLYLDMDLYLGTKAAIEACLPRMPRGAVIAFDEFACPRWPGETQGLLETLGVRGTRLRRFTYDSHLSYLVLD